MPRFFHQNGTTARQTERLNVIGTQREITFTICSSWNRCHYLGCAAWPARNSVCGEVGGYRPPTATNGGGGGWDGYPPESGIYGRMPSARINNGAAPRFNACVQMLLFRRLHVRTTTGAAIVVFRLPVRRQGSPHHHPTCRWNVA